MAWRLVLGKSNAELVGNLKSSGILSSDRVAKAMAQVDRANYVLDKRDAYDDSPQSIGHGVTISAPHMHAYAAEHLLPPLRPGARVLDVGSGSGYLVSVLHTPGEPGGKVVGIDHIPELVDWSVENLRKDGAWEVLESKEIELLLLLCPPALLEQLAKGGRMFIPVGTHSQWIEHVDKDEDGHVTKTRVMGVRYVPLTDRDRQVG
ncbi:Pcmt1-prov protein [Coprinopsis sp. MPI-PUGE-AT-0042]|nr:Pcmt1-prov protein [Coprinopsis sp. MPI-PUGE-AT-0042]